MRAIILAAGEGTRLKPYTDNIPKCMVKLAGKPLLHRQIEVLRSMNLEDIMVVGGYCAKSLDSLGAETSFNPNYMKTNMVATLFCAEDWMKEEDLLICYGDIVYEQRVIESLIACSYPIGVSIDRSWKRLWDLRMDDPLSDAETLSLTNSDRIIEIGKKATSFDQIDGQYIGLIKVRSDFVRPFKDAWYSLDRQRLYDGKDLENMYMTSFLQHLIDIDFDVRAAFTENGWLEVDTAEDLELYERCFHEGTLKEIINLDKCQLHQK